MNPETRQALEGSIIKWQGIVAGTTEELGSENCPLCAKFNRRDDPPEIACRGCPVFERTGQEGCDGTPYDDYWWHEPPEIRIPVAERMRDFLISLRPTE